MKGAKAIVILFLIVCCFNQGLASTNEVASATSESGHELSWFGFPWFPHLPWLPIGRWPCPPPAHPPSSAAQQLAMSRKFMNFHTKDAASATSESGHELSWFGFPWFPHLPWFPIGRWPCPPPAHPPSSAAQRLAMSRNFMVPNGGSTN